MKRSFGGALLVVGTTVGVGMLSLPLVTAACGLLATIILLILSWSVMLFTAFRLLRLCAGHPEGVNFTTLINKRMPIWMQLGFTVIYLLLLYSLMAAYTTQGASVVHTISEGSLPFVPVDTLIFILIFGFFIASCKLSDYLNRSFLTIKFMFFIVSVISMCFYINWSYLGALPISLAAIIYAWPTLLPSFGFQNIIPVLYEYQQGDLSAIKRSTLIGSLLVLIIYVIWVFVCFANLPQHGTNSYAALFHHGNTLNQFIHAIQAHTQSRWINRFLSIFINISVVTSFICTGLSLYHYLKDCFQRFKIKIHTLFALFLTFLPPYLFTVTYPKGFILALQYASIFAVFVFVYAPVLLGRNALKVKINYYPLVMGTLVIIAQILNLTDIIVPFH